MRIDPAWVDQAVAGINNAFVGARHKIRGHFRDTAVSDANVNFASPGRFSQQAGHYGHGVANQDGL